MKRFILGLAIVGVVIVAVGGASYVVVKYAIDQAGLPVHGGQNAPAPFKYTQLVKMMEASDKPAESDIANLIGCFDKSEMVEGENTALGIHASEVLVQIGQPAVKPLRERLKDKNTKVRYYAVHTLSRLGSTAEPATNDLLERLKDSDSDIRCKAAYALGQVGAKDKIDPIIEGLVKVLEDPDGDVSRTAVESLQKIGAPGLPRMYQLVAGAKNPAQGRLLQALETIGSPPSDALPVLTILVKDPNESVRHPAMKLLGQLGAPAVPTLKELLRKPHPEDLMILPHAIATLDADAAKGVLPEMQVLLVEIPYWDAQEQWMGTLKKCGPDGAHTLTNILKILQDPKSPHFESDPRSLPMKGEARSLVAIRTLGEMGSEAKIAAPTLVELLGERPSLRPNILDALGDIGPAAREAAAPSVQKILADNSVDPQVAEKARTALLRMGAIQKGVEKSK